MFKKILIANRGEIACRVIKTIQRMGIKAVAVFSTLDRSALHASLADEAYLLGHAASKDSYLNMSAIINLAQQHEIDAIHPGYGFLSENYEFALRCEQAGIVFIGPPSAVIKQMASKAAAKQTLGKTDVPLIPGYQGEKQDLLTLGTMANNIGYPVLIKASHGGGGKGMRLVHSADDFSEALASCQREAFSAFGNSEVILEKYLTQPRHIEVQIFADNFGNTVHLFERDCSIQRRHQKIIEEAPAYNLTTAIRNNMYHAAITTAQAIGYRGAGTIEFLYENDRFYFMEMNTRLQVEHPITEMITGIDLVEWQILISANQPLPLSQVQINSHGHAIEVRICAEDPTNDFLPSTGTIEHIIAPTTNTYELPDYSVDIGTAPPVITGISQLNMTAKTVPLNIPTKASVVALNSLRIDSGSQANDHVSIYYDSLLMKVIVHATTRATAVSKLQFVLNNLYIIGLQNNINFLRNLTQWPEYTNGDIDINFIANHYKSNNLHSDWFTHAGLIAATICTRLHSQLAANATEDCSSPWLQPTNWHTNHTPALCDIWLYKDKSWQVANAGHNYYINNIAYNTTVESLTADSIASKYPAIKLTLAIDTNIYKAIAIHTANGCYISLNSYAAPHDRNAIKSNSYTFIANYDYYFYYPNHGIMHAHPHDDNALSAPMPGIISKILVNKGSKVAANAPLLILEAMKIEHTIKAPFSGTISALHYNKGDIVEEGCTLISIDPLLTQEK